MATVININSMPPELLGKVAAFLGDPLCTALVSKEFQEFSEVGYKAIDEKCAEFEFMKYFRSNRATPMLRVQFLYKKIIRAVGKSCLNLSPVANSIDAYRLIGLGTGLRIRAMMEIHNRPPQVNTLSAAYNKVIARMQA